MIAVSRVASVKPMRADLQAKLEQEYEGHTAALEALLRRRHRRPGGGEPAAAEHTRRALADVALALRRMAEGSYGRCERCTGTISRQVLQLSPTARYCHACADLPGRP